MPDLIRSIKTLAELPPILLICGEEEFLVEQAYKKIVSLSSGEINSYDCQIIDARDATLETVVEQCRTYPFVAEKRFVAVRNFETYFSGRKKVDEKSPFAKYLKSPSPTTALVLVAQAEQLNGLNDAFKKNKEQKLISSLKFPYKELIENHTWIEYPKIWEREFPAWIKKRFATIGKDISTEACEMLTTITNPTLRDLNNEIEKLLLFIGETKSVTVDHVLNVAGGTRTFNVFELQKAVGQRKIALSIEILEKMLATERVEMLILAVLTKYFTALWRLTEERLTTSNQYQLASAIGISSFFVNEYLDALSRYSPTDIEKAFFALTEADEALKTSSTDSLTVLEKAFIEIIGIK